jgi:hypothetical protein
LLFGEIVHLAHHLREFLVILSAHRPFLLSNSRRYTEASSR